MLRKQSSLFVVVSLFLTGVVLAAEEPQTGDDVLKQLQGTWKFTAKDSDGKASSAAELAKMTITFTGDKWVVRDDGKSVQEGSHKFDPTKKPGHVDAPVSAGEGKGTTMIGIYELTGDTMKVCFDTQSKTRPTSFTAKAGQMSAIVQREKK